MNNRKEIINLKCIARDILIVKRGLEDEGVESPWLATLGELATRVSHASRNEATRLGGVEVRLDAIKETLKKALA